VLEEQTLLWHNQYIVLAFEIREDPTGDLLISAPVAITQTSQPYNADRWVESLLMKLLETIHARPLKAGQFYQVVFEGPISPPLDAADDVNVYNFQVTELF
jgi:hypothetical protein